MKNSAATLCSLSLCFWGYQTGAWNLAIPMILALELRNLIKRRWTISWEHFKFIHVLAAFTWLLSIFYIPSSSPASIPYAASYHIVKCIPVGLFPLILFQTYCTNFGNLYGSLLKQSYEPHKNINLYYPYFGICLLSASATGGNTVLFLSITAGLVTLFLGSLRSQRFSPAMFYSLIGVALILSIIGANQFYWLRANVKPKSPELFSSLSQALTSILQQDYTKTAKDLFNKDPLQQIEQHAKNTADTASKSDTQSTQPSQNSGSPQIAAQPTQSPQNTASTSAILSIEGAGSASAETSKSATQATELAQASGAAKSAIQAIQGSKASQNPPASTSSINSPSNTGQQSKQPTSAVTSISAQSVTQSTEATAKTAETKSFQQAGQSGENTNPINSSQSSQNESQNPTSASKNIPPVPSLIQQGGGTTDPNKSLTQIGNTGSLQPSDAILFRVAPNNEKKSNYLAENLPLYIRESTYNQYSSGAWDAVNPTFSPQNSGSNKRQWILGTQTTNTTSVRISAALPQGTSVLKLPIGTSKIDHPTIDAMQVNQYGSVMVQGTPGKSSYTVEFDPTQSLDSPPTQMDLDIPVIEKPGIQKILDALNLRGQSQNEAIQRVSAFFKQNFEYSLELPSVSKNSTAPKNSTPLSNFLLNYRSGHCEYFASATALLLRSAGIATRYVVGYSVHEYSPSEQQYVVRARNAHAWVMAYVNGAWMTVDTTPSAGQLQNGNSGNTEKTLKNRLSQDKKSDLTSEKLKGQNNDVEKAADQDKKFKNVQAFIAKISDELKLHSTRLTKNLDPRVGSSAIILLGLAIILLSIFFSWWFSRRHFSRRSKSLRHSTARFSRQPKDDDLASAFARIEKRLTQWGVERKSSETMRQWIIRLNQKLPESKMNHLNEIIDLHYRYRFDPQGIEQEDCEKLRSMIQSWLMETAT